MAHKAKRSAAFGSERAHPPHSPQTRLQRNAQAFGASLKSTPILIAASFSIYVTWGCCTEAWSIQSTSQRCPRRVSACCFIRKSGIMLVDFAQQVEHSEGCRPGCSAKRLPRPPLASNHQRQSQRESDRSLGSRPPN
jgi:hypothetical protein